MDELIQTWFTHHLQIIGEAARGLTSTFRENNPEAPWKQMIGMRNVLAHGYFGVDHDGVWEVIERDLPNLKGNIVRIIGKSENRGQ